MIQTATSTSGSVRRSAKARTPDKPTCLARPESASSQKTVRGSTGESLVADGSTHRVRVRSAEKRLVTRFEQLDDRRGLPAVHARLATLPHAAADPRRHVVPRPDTGRDGCDSRMGSHDVFPWPPRSRRARHRTGARTEGRL